VASDGKGLLRRARILVGDQHVERGSQAKAILGLGAFQGQARRRLLRLRRLDAQTVRLQLAPALNGDLHHLAANRFDSDLIASVLGARLPDLGAYAVSIADLVSQRGSLRLAILIDIEPELRVAEATALRELMQVLSHEIMNALTPVASLASSARDILLEDPAAPAEAVDALATLARRAEGLTRFVEAYRTLARLPEPVLARVSLHDLLEEAAQLFRGRWATRGVRLDLVQPVPGVFVEIDFDLMVHALANVLSNGAEAALAGAHAAPAVTLAADVSLGAARLVVDDNGPGVRPADQEAIFRPFFTTKTYGSGVGLSFARQVALSHGGGLTLISPGPAGGARFILAL
jgi:two-component system nitrogen regulation sensor histidine kinase NtrY